MSLLESGKQNLASDVERFKVLFRWLWLVGQGSERLACPKQQVDCFLTGKAHQKSFGKSKVSEFRHRAKTCSLQEVSRRSQGIASF